jgi:PAS domain S-box-containing protein
MIQGKSKEPHTPDMANGSSQSVAAAPQSRPRRGFWLPITSSYAFAVLVVVLATLLRWWLIRNIGPMPTFITWYPAVLLVASLGGLGPGIAATIFSALAADYWFIPPKGLLKMDSAADGIALGIFTGTSLALCFLAERVQRARWTEAVRATQEQELALLDMGNLLALDPSHRIHHWSRGCTRLYGYDATEAEGRSVDELLETVFPMPRQRIEEILKRDGHWEGQVTRRAKDGSNRVIAILWAVRRDEAGFPGSILEVSTDVTASQKAEDALRQKEALLRGILNATKESIWMFSPEGVILLGNETALSFFGKTKEEVIGKNLSEILPPELARSRLARVKEVVESSLPVEFEDQRSGIHFQHSYYPVLDDGKQVSCIASFSRDITERKKAETSLRHANEELERSNHDLEQFAYAASHDLQEPLRQIRSFVQLLRERYMDRLDGKAAQYLDFVYEGGVRMTALVQGLLAYSRVGAEDTIRERTSCTEALQMALANLQGVIAETGARVSFDDLPVLRGNPTQLAQVFQNLIENAIKFHREAIPPEIHVGCRGRDHDWLLWVRDNGIGIAPPNQEKVFTIFHRLHARDRYPGTGIGLALVKKIVVQHGGAIWIESSEGEGATFYFSLQKDDIA